MMANKVTYHQMMQAWNVIEPDNDADIESIEFHIGEAMEALPYFGLTVNEAEQTISTGDDFLTMVGHYYEELNEYAELMETGDDDAYARSDNAYVLHVINDLKGSGDDTLIDYYGSFVFMILEAVAYVVIRNEVAEIIIDHKEEVISTDEAVKLILALPKN